MTLTDARREIAEDCWSITEHNRATGAAIEELGSSFLIGNGYMGYRGTLEEDTRERMTATIVAGLYDRVGDQWREPVNMPNALSVQVIADGAPLDARTCPLESHSQSLDLHRGVHERKTSFAGPNGNPLSVTCTRFASATYLHLLCLRCTLEARRDCTVVLRIRIDGDMWDLNGRHLEGLFSSIEGDVASLSARTHERGLAVAVSQCISAAGAEMRHELEENGAAANVIVPLSAGVPFTVDVFAAVYTGLDCSDPVLSSQAESRMAAARGFDDLLQKHCDLWESRWERCDIVIDGDPEAQCAMRFNMYHLLSIAPAHSSSLSIPARGLSGQMYKGAIFWDTEVFMLPFFMFTFPGIARNLLMYRFHTLNGARRKAREYGYRGAFYAWESQENGDDACTLFNVIDVNTQRLIRTYFRDKQIHISADVVYAFWEYFATTGDESILLDGGAEVIFECCRFLLSWLYFSRERKRYEVLDVTGPDEYHERVHNDAWTNWITAHAMAVCTRVFDFLEANHPRKAAALIEELDFARDIAAIREVSGEIYLPAPEDGSLVIPQFDGYLKLEDVPLEKVLQRKLHPHEYLGGGNGVAVTTQVIKQADVVLGLALLGRDQSPEVKAANWDYYEPRTEHGSSLSACAYSIVASETGRMTHAYDYFMKAATTDMGAPHKSFVGTLYIGGTHPAASGGAWMAAVFGLCGISVKDGMISVSPRLPAHWRQVTMPLSVQGTEYRITVSSQSITIKADHAGSARIMVHGHACSMPASGALTISLRQEARGGVSGHMRAGIFDLDGVIVDTAKYHFLAWKRLAGELGFDFTPADNERLKGVSRMRSLEILLEIGGLSRDEEERRVLAERKNGWYVQYIHAMDETEILPGAASYVRSLRTRGIKTAVASASKNAPLILERLGVAPLFDAVVDGTSVSRTKPDPEVFLLAASALGIPPAHCVVFEDAQAGIEAARSAGMSVIGIGRPEDLHGADMVVPGLMDLLPAATPTGIQTPRAHIPS